MSSVSGVLADWMRGSFVRQYSMQAWMLASALPAKWAMLRSSERESSLSLTKRPISHASVAARNLDESDHEYKIAQQYYAALADATQKDIHEVRGYPLFGMARRFDGAQYIGDFPRGPILSFVDKFIGIAWSKVPRKPAPPPPQNEDDA